MTDDNDEKTRVVRLDDIRRIRDAERQSRSWTFDAYDDAPEDDAGRHVALVEKPSEGACVAIFVPPGFDGEGIVLAPYQARQIAIGLIEMAAKADERNGTN